MKLTSRWTKYVLALVLTLGLSSLAWTTQATQTKTKSKAITVTGCLQKGDEAGAYSLKSEDGKFYELRSTTADLAKLLGHKVIVTGSKMREENEAKEKK